MNQPVRVVLVAVGGYGNTYANAMLDGAAAHDCQIVGVVDPFAEGCRRLDELKALGIPFYDDLDAFYAENE
ncbi:MAG: gfo/Idh/MocA family oxidoreductase, partial [Victivallales bacterium]|nr:gfo/Idh/MocA family oxidoreductase [Victivallales bacterium]